MSGNAAWGVDVVATSSGEGTYDVHAAGLKRVTNAAKEANVATESTDRTMSRFKSGLTAAALAAALTSRALRQMGIENKQLEAVLNGVAIGLGVARAGMSAYKAVQESSALASMKLSVANWKLAASQVASSAWLAPVLLGVITAAAIAVLASSAAHAQTGFSGVVTGPRTLLVGEAGPEEVMVRPVGAGAMGGGRSIGSVSISISGAGDPDAVARAVADALLDLEDRGL